MKRLLYLILLIAVTSTGFSEVESKEVTYQVGTEVMKGYLSQPAETPRSVPGILVVHEWWGHNDYARSRAEQLAELGYVALAVDMYGEGKKADHPKTAGQFASAVMSNQELAKARFLAAMELLKANPYVNQEKLGAIGYCFGGATVLNMARLGLDLKGVVSFHGSLASSVTAESPIQTKILVCHGGSDSFISEDEIRDFKKEMEDAEADMTFKAYPGAKHSFTNPDADQYAKDFGIGVGYQEAADKASWKDMTEFFQTLFQ